MAFTVTYNGNGATGGSVPVDGNAYSNNSLVTVLDNTGKLTLTGQTVTGATFAYWNTAPGGNGTKYVPGAQFNITGPVTLYAQWYVTTGLTKGGVTTHYAFAYDSALEVTPANPSGLEPARINTLLAPTPNQPGVPVCESDYNLMAGWFDNIPLTLSTPIPTYVNNEAGGAGWRPPLILKPGSGDATLCRYLMVSEVTEMFMLAQNKGWYAPDGSNEQSCGEGLSRFLAQQFLLSGGNGLVSEPGFQISPSWLNSSLPSSNPSSTQLGGVLTTLTAPIDYAVTTFGVALAQTISFETNYLIQIDSEQMLVTNVNTSTNTLTVTRGSNGTTAVGHAANATVAQNYGSRADYVNTTLEYDHGIDPATGCAMLFIYYLQVVLGFSINAIIAAAPGVANASNCLRGVYRNLTGDNSDPFPPFKQLLDTYFPPDQAAPTNLFPNPDNPFPLTPYSQGADSSFALSTAADTVEVFWVRGDGMVFTNGRLPNFNQGNWNQPINPVGSAAGSADPRSRVAAVSTSPGTTEVFWIRGDGMVFTNGRSPNFNQGNWNQPINPVGPAPGSADPRSGIAAVCSSPGTVEVFWIRGDGMVFTNGRSPNFNQGNWNQPINSVASAPGSADPRSGVAAVCSSPGAVEVFWIRPDGMVFTNARIPNFNQGNWNQPINSVASAAGSADPRSGVAAASSSPGAVEVFWVRPDGIVFTNARDPNFNQNNWNQPIEVGSGADPRSGVAAVSRQFGCVDVFWVSATGQIMTSNRNPSTNFGRFSLPIQIAPPGSAYSSSPVGVVCSSPNAVEVFWVRSDGMVFTNAQNPNINDDNWNNPINSVAASPGSAATPQR
jgi:hypothetical protein